VCVCVTRRFGDGWIERTNEQSIPQGACPLRIWYSIFSKNDSLRSDTSHNVAASSDVIPDETGWPLLECCYGILFYVILFYAIIMASILTSLDTLLFAVTAALVTLQKKASATDASCPSLANGAFVFVKPHANTPACQNLVRQQLQNSNIRILQELDIDGPTIDEKKLIDQHYYAIASKATILEPKDIPVPADKFREAFGEEWSQVLKDGKAANAMQACRRFGCSPTELDAAWQTAKVTKLGGGFYCGLVEYKQQSLYVFNAFFMSMRSKFVGKEDSIHCFVVEFDPARLSWSDFRNKVLGPTDPAEGPKGSLRRTILENYQKLGLSSKPNKGDNGVHASASPFEGLAEKLNWLGRKIEQDPFGKALLAAGLSKKTIEAWSVDPQVKLTDGSKASVFDTLEDMDVDECLQALIDLNKIN